MATGGGHSIHCGVGSFTQGQTHELVPTMAIGSVATMLTTDGPFVTGIREKMVMFTGAEVLDMNLSKGTIPLLPSVTAVNA
jgi:hypothetical protein